MSDNFVMGRPSDFTSDTADKICERLINGESLRAICRDDGMPHAATVCRWLTVNEQFRDQYTRAREAQADTLADEILDISDDARNDWMERAGPDGQGTGWQLNGESIQRSRLRVDARKWYAGKLRPQKYGEKIQTEHSGSIGTHNMTDEELDRRIAEAMGKSCG